VNILSGSMRSGKTIASIYRFLGFLINEAKPGVSILITAKHKDLIEQNLFLPMKQIVAEEKIDGAFDFSRNPIRMTFLPKNILCFCAGAKDDRAEDGIRGMTIQAWLGDEITLYPESFFNMAMSRLSHEPRVAFLTCNPDMLTHFVYRKWIATREAKNFKFSLTDNPSLDPGYIEKLKKGYTGVYYTRYIEGEWGGSDDSLVIPEYFEARDEILQTRDLPPSYVPMMSLDVGWRDFTFALFGYYDFADDMIVIDDEVVIKKNMNTEMLARMTKEKEDELFGKPCVARFTDIDLRLIEDMSVLHSLHFIPTRKDDKEAAINNLRILIKNRKIRINSKCVELDKHLSGAFWNDRRTTYERTEECGHFDGVDALIYFVRNIIRRNPYASQESTWQKNGFFVSPKYQKEVKEWSSLKPKIKEPFEINDSSGSSGKTGFTGSKWRRSLMGGGKW